MAKKTTKKLKKGHEASTDQDNHDKQLRKVLKNAEAGQVPIG